MEKQTYHRYTTLHSSLSLSLPLFILHSCKFSASDVLFSVYSLNPYVEHKGTYPPSIVPKFHFRLFPSTLPFLSSPPTNYVGGHELDFPKSNIDPIQI